MAFPNEAGVSDEDRTMIDAVPALPHIVLAPDGTPALIGTRCGACGAVVEGTRLACPACGARDALATAPFAGAGTIHAHTVVHRSYPGVETPFVAVVVDLDGGGTLRGTLREADPLAPPPDRVALRFVDSGQRDRQGRPFLSYVFVPEGARR